jgi:predicted esterase/predicted RNA-binding Zn-ribbon protein involved in translation (DUF1610 family)
MDVSREVALADFILMSPAFLEKWLRCLRGFRDSFASGNARFPLIDTRCYFRSDYLYISSSIGDQIRVNLMTGLHVDCPHCGIRLPVKDRRSLGRRVPCPKCGEEFKLEADGFDAPDSLVSEDRFQPEPDRKTGKSKPSFGRGVAILLILVFGMGAVRSLLKDRGNADIPLRPAVNPGLVERIQNAQLGEAELLEVGEQFAAGLNGKDVEVVAQLLNADRLLDITLSGIALSGRSKADLRKGFLIGLKRRNGLLGELAANLEDGGAKFLRLRSDGQQRLLLRLMNQDGTVNYIELIPERNPPAGIKIVDFYMYNSGETISRTMRRLFLPLLVQGDSGFLARLSGADRKAAEFGERLQLLAQAAQVGQGEQFMKIYRQLPEELQRDKALLLMRIRVFQQTDEEQYLATLEDFRKFYPNDVALDFILLDYHFLKEDYESLEKSLTNLEKALGGDTYLSRIRAEILISQNKLDEARKQLEQLLAEEPDLKIGHFTLVSVLARQEDHPATFQELKLIREKFGVEFPDFTVIPEFEPFTKTDEYEEYRKIMLTPVAGLTSQSNGSGFDPTAAEWRIPVADPRPVIWIDDWSEKPNVSQGRAEAKQLASQADRLKAQSRFAEAEKSYRDAMKADPEWPYPIYQLTCNYVLAGRDDDALATFRSVVKAGFSNFTMAVEDEELGFLRDLPEFAVHMKTIHRRCIDLGDSDTGQAVAFRPAGDAAESGWPVMLLLHGYGDTNEAYFDSARKWVELGFLTVALPGSVPMGDDRFQWSGSAETTRRDLKAVLDASSLASLIDRKQVFLLGFSQGAMHSLIVAAGHPDEFAGVIALSPGGQLSSFMARPEFTQGDGHLMLVYGSEEPHGRFVTPLSTACRDAGWKFSSRMHTGDHHFPIDWETIRPAAARFLREN